MNQAYESASFVRCVVPETADIQAASAAVAANPESGDAWMKKGHALAKVSMMREAEECYAMAISCDPFNWEYYRHRAHRFLSCWRFEDAAADFVIASRLNPNDWNVFYHLGLSYFLLRDYAKAAKAYARCYELTDAEPELIAVTDWYYMTLKRLGNDGARSASGVGFGDSAMTAMFIGLVCAYIGSYIGAFVSGEGVFTCSGDWTPLAVAAERHEREHAERTGIGLCQQPFDSKSGLNKRPSSQSFWYSRVSASTPSVRESGRRNAVLRFQVGIAKADTSVSAFWYSRRESNP